MNLIRSIGAFFGHHGRVLGALMMRELVTRFGREGLGFVWLIAEPMLFCLGVMTLWSFTKPAYEHGVRLAPFVMTGYMSLLLIRHQIGLSQGALTANIGLLHHKQIAIMHLYLARNILEVAGTSIAFVAVYILLIALNLVSLPHDWLLLYGGWIILAFMAMGFALILAGLAMRFEEMERVVPLLSYLLIPISGAFFMVSWLPMAIRPYYLYVPFPHTIEMVRAGVFGEFVETHFDPTYAIVWAAIFNVVGMVLIYGARDRVDVE